MSNLIWQPSHYSPGIQVLIKLPKSLPNWVSPTWKHHLRAFNGIIDKVTTQPKTAKQLGWTRIPEATNFYFVDLEYARTQTGALGVWNSHSYFAIDWLSPLTAHYKTTCDCPLQVLMNRGCQKSYHQ